MLSRYTKKTMKFKPSKMWINLSKTSEDYLSKFGYENFKRSVGLIYNDYYFDHDKKKLDDNYEDKVKIVWDSLYMRFPNNLLAKFHEPPHGNPLSVEYKGRHVSLDLAASILETLLIMSEIDTTKVEAIHEIGGGYGRLAYVLSQMVPHAKYRMYDIEPSLGLAHRYLDDVLPDNEFEFYPPNKLNGKCDILIAMDCLHEMTVDTVNDYFDYADKNAKYFYYTCWKETYMREDGIRWKINDYPVRKKWKALYFGQHRMRTQFFEALYQI